jgi:hypothetical protein
VKHEETSTGRLGQPKQPINAKQQLSKNIPAAMNTNMAIEELLENRHNRETMERELLFVQHQGHTRRANQSFETVLSWK